MTKDPRLNYTPVKLSPMTRLRVAFENEISRLDAEQVSKLRGDFHAREDDARGTRDRNFKALVVLDALLVLVLSGKHIILPIVGLNTAELPVLLETVLALASLAFYVFCFTFTNWLAYNQIYNVFCVREAAVLNVDPDAIFAAELANELQIKIMRANFNLWGIDWHTPRLPFLLVSTAYGVGVATFFLALPFVHGALIYYAFDQLLQTPNLSWMHWMLLAWSVLCHTLGLMVWMVPNLSFSFDQVTGPKETK